MIFCENIKKLSKKFWSNQKLLVLGGTGFLGKEFVSILESLGCADYKILTRNKKIRNPKYIRCDLTKASQIRAIRSYIKDAGYIFIFSSNFPQSSNIDISFRSFLDNVIMVQNLMAEISDRTKKIILASSTDVYGMPKTSFVNEGHIANPINYYALSKYTQERIVEYKLRDKIDKCLILRFTSIYGRNDPHVKFLPVLLKSVVNDKSFIVYGDGSEKRDLIDVEDAAMLALYLVQENASGTFNVSTGEGITINQLLKIAKSISKKRISVQYRDRINPGRNLAFDNEKLLSFIRDFRYKPISEGIKQQYEAILGRVKQ